MENILCPSNAYYIKGLSSEHIVRLNTPQTHTYPKASNSVGCDQRYIKSLLETSALDTDVYQIAINKKLPNTGEVAKFAMVKQL